MKKFGLLVTALFVFAGGFHEVSAQENTSGKNLIGNPGLRLSYSIDADDIPESVVRKFELFAGPVKGGQGTLTQWFCLSAEKENKQSFSVWILARAYPATSLDIAQKNILRYLFSNNQSGAIEFMDQNNGTPVLPDTGAWKHLLPRTENGKSPFTSFEKRLKYLGHEYSLVDNHAHSEFPSLPKEIITIELTPDLLIGVPHNSKVKDETRRYDESDYEYIELTKDNYAEMIEHGINVFNVNSEQAKWIEMENVYYWGIGGDSITYPEHLYRSNYIGPAMFFDEPMVHTRDQILKPKFKADPTLRKRVTPEMFFEEFKHEFHEAKYERSPTSLLKGLAQRDDVDIGTMDFLQQNVYSWETMISSALYQLSEGDNTTPSAIVFEPPGRLGAKRVLPELNMSFDCQIPIDDPKNLIGIIKGFARGAARVTDKDWGISIYGQVVRSEAYWFMTHAYEQGATRFFYWDSYQLAAVPYSEYLALSKNLREHVKNFPQHDVNVINQAAEVAIVLPKGYNLGHVKMGIGNFAGLPELNMERRNSYGLKYRDVMNNFYIEIERCIRLGVEYDLFWNLENLKLEGYREIITIRKDGKVEVEKSGARELLQSARVPERPEGESPQLSVEVDTTGAKVHAKARVSEREAPIYYTQGANKDGVYRNTYVLWELYGPEEEDYTDFWNDRWGVVVSEENKTATVDIDFQLNKPGKYRLRVSTCDAAGRSTVVWKTVIRE